MSGVATYTQPDHTSQVGNVYKNNLDAATAALRQTVDGFLPHESSPAAMTVTVDAGRLENAAGNLVEVGQQVTGAIVAPSSDPRHDLVVIDRDTGVVEVVTGAEAGAPVDPALPSGKKRVARVRLATTTTAIDNSLIDNIIVAGGGPGTVQTIATMTLSGQAEAAFLGIAAAGFELLEWQVSDLSFVDNTQSLLVQLGSASAWITTADYYSDGEWSYTTDGTGNQTTYASGAATDFWCGPSQIFQNNIAGARHHSMGRLANAGIAEKTFFTVSSHAQVSAPPVLQRIAGIAGNGVLESTEVIDRIRFRPLTGNMSGKFTLRGVPLV